MSQVWSQARHESTYLLLGRADSSRSFPLLLVVVRGRLAEGVDVGVGSASFSFCLAFTLALDRNVLDSVWMAAEGCDVDGLLDVASDCWVMSI